MIAIETIQKAAARLDAEGIRYVLVGSAALSLHGCDVDAHDLDFLCARGPTPTPEEQARTEDQPSGAADDHPLNGDAASSGLRTMIDGVPVDYIDASEAWKERGRPSRLEFLKPHRNVQRVWLASIDDVIGLKRAANREKDRIFLDGWDAARSFFEGL